MAEKISTPLTSGFFGSKFKTDLPLTPTAITKPKLLSVDVGGDADSGFRSAAAAMIDNIILVRSRGNQELAKRLLDIHGNYFAQPQIQLRLMTHAEVLARLLESTAIRAKFVNELAYALRQETVSEMVHQPEKYRFALVNGKEIREPEEMRLQSSNLHQSAMAALSKVTQVSVLVHEVEPNKEGQRVTAYSRGIQQPAPSPIDLLQQGDIYYPLLNRPDYFAMINRQRVEPVNPKAESFANDPLLAEILVRVADEDKHLFQEYEKTVKCLYTMLQADELSKDDLLNAYIKSLKTEHQGQTKYAGIENGSQHLFEEIQQSRKLQMPMQTAILSHEERLINELVHALARGIVTGQVDPSLIFEVEERSSLAVR